jgi:nitrite reductase (NADH) small subunit
VIVKLCDASALPPEGELKAFQGFGREICVARAGGLYSFDNRCPHQNAPLSAGTLNGTTVVCPYHAWRFDMCSGMAELAGDPLLMCFEIRQYGTEVFVALPDAPEEVQSR